MRSILAVLCFYVLLPLSRIKQLIDEHHRALHSAEGHVGSFGSIPAGVLGRLSQLDQLTEAGLNYHSLLFAFIKQLLLSSRKGLVLSTIELID